MDERINERGNKIKSGFIGDTDRLEFDFGVCSAAKGWTQWDTSQDASYFGIWVHPIKREIVTYAEGDLTIIECATEESFKMELETMAAFYGEAPPCAIGYAKDENGRMIKTEYYDKRFMG